MNCTICGLPTGNIVGSVLPQCKCGWQAPQPPKAHRQPLTLEKLREHWEGAKVLDITDAEINFADYVFIVRDVEALYGIKGEE